MRENDTGLRLPAGQSTLAPLAFTIRCPSPATRFPVAVSINLGRGVILDGHFRLCAAISKGKTVPQGGIMSVFRQTFVGLSFVVASTMLAQAAEPLHLRVADSFPKGHFLVKLMLEPWME